MCLGRAVPRVGAASDVISPTISIMGHTLFNVLGLVAECEADLPRLRTHEGIAVAQATS